MKYTVKKQLFKRWHDICMYGCVHIIMSDARKDRPYRQPIALRSETCSK